MAHAPLRRLPARRTSISCAALLAWGAVAVWAGKAMAQEPLSPHYPYSTALPPGAVGAWRVERGGPIRGYFQQVELKAPEGVQIALAADGNFTESQDAPVKVGMLVAPVYRLKVTNVPNRDGEELFPTIEIVDRVYPPRGKHRQFPIPVELTETDLNLALDGNFVTRVIYIEDPTAALPRAEGQEQSWFDAGPGANPVEVADRLGRPVAILRMGGVTPDPFEGPDMRFLNGCPPFTVFQPYTQVTDAAREPSPAQASEEAATSEAPSQITRVARRPASRRAARVERLPAGGEASDEGPALETASVEGER